MSLSELHIVFEIVSFNRSSCHYFVSITSVLHCCFKPMTLARILHLQGLYSHLIDKTVVNLTLPLVKWLSQDLKMIKQILTKKTTIVNIQNEYSFQGFHI